MIDAVRYDSISSLLLMCADTAVMSIDVSAGKYDVLVPQLVPYSLQDSFEALPQSASLLSCLPIIRHNEEQFRRWLASRVLALSRKNAKKLYSLLKIEQLTDDYSKAEVALMCRAVSLLDNYWVKLERDNTTWADVNLRHNSLNSVIAQVALHGTSLSLQGSLNTPELTTNGSYAKAWRRYEDGSLWLHKLGENGTTEARIEVMCSRLLDKMNVSHCYYTITKDDGKVVSACPAMTNDNLSIADFINVYSYCNKHNKDALKFMRDLDPEGLYKMWIVDFLLANRDRHGQNWGIYFDPKTNKPLRLHPLFDHNNAFDIEYMRDRNPVYQAGNIKLGDAARLAMHHVDFHFEIPIMRYDFITDRQYNEFMARAADLGIQTIRNPIWVVYCRKYKISDEYLEFHRLRDLYKLPDSSVFYDKLQEDFL